MADLTAEQRRKALAELALRPVTHEPIRRYLTVEVDGAEVELEDYWTDFDPDISCKLRDEILHRLQGQRVNVQDQTELETFAEPHRLLESLARGKALVGGKWPITLTDGEMSTVDVPKDAIAVAALVRRMPPVLIWRLVAQAVDIYLGVTGEVVREATDLPVASGVASDS